MVPRSAGKRGAPVLGDGSDEPRVQRRHRGEYGGQGERALKRGRRRPIIRLLPGGQEDRWLRYGWVAPMAKSVLLPDTEKPSKGAP